MNRLRRGVYLITEDRFLDFQTLVARSESALQSGIAALQYRKKDAAYSHKQKEATKLKDLCLKYDTPFIINDDIKLALEIDADGIHLGEHDDSCKQARTELGESKLIGISCYNDFHIAENAIKESADYLAFGAMFPTKTKTRTRQASMQILSSARQMFSVPLVAIGGITPRNCQPLIAAGADLLAVVSSVYDSDRPDVVINEFNRQF